MMKKVAASKTDTIRELKNVSLPGLCSPLSTDGCALRPNLGYDRLSGKHKRSVVVAEKRSHNQCDGSQASLYGALTY